MALHRLLIIGLEEPSDRSLIALANAADINKKNILFFDRSDDINHIVATAFSTEKGQPFYGDSKVILMDNIAQERLLKFRQLTRAMEVSENHQAISSLDDLTESMIDSWFRNVRFSKEELERDKKRAAERANSSLTQDEQIMSLLEDTDEDRNSGNKPRGDDITTVLGPKHKLTDNVNSFMDEIPDEKNIKGIIDKANDQDEVLSSSISDFESIDDDNSNEEVSMDEYSDRHELDSDPLAILDVESSDTNHDEQNPVGSTEDEEFDPLSRLDDEPVDSDPDPLSGLDLEATPQGLDLSESSGPKIAEESSAPIRNTLPSSIIDSDEDVNGNTTSDLSFDSAPPQRMPRDTPNVTVPKSRLTDYVADKPPVVRSEEPEPEDESSKIIPRRELLRQQKEERESALSDEELTAKRARDARAAAEGRDFSTASDESTMFSDSEDAKEAASLNRQTTEPARKRTGMDFESIPMADDIMTQEQARAQRIHEADREMYRKARNPEHSIGHRGRITVVSGGSGGTGKTLTSWGMWYALILARNEAGENSRGTWLIEADYDSPKYQRVHMDMKDTQDLGSFAKLLRSCSDKGVTLSKEEIQNKLVNEFSYYDKDHGGRILACPRDRGDIEDKFLFMAIVQAIRAVSDMGGAVIVDMADSDNRNTTAINNVILHRLADQIVLTCTPSTAGAVRDLAKNITTADRTGSRPYKPVPLGRVHLALVQATDVQAEQLQENFFSPLKVDIFIPTIPDLLPTNLLINKMGIGHISMASKAVKRAVMIRCGSLLVSCGYSDYDKFFRSNPQITSKASADRKPGFIEKMASRFS